LKASDFTTKQLIIEPANKNSPAVKEERKEYVAWASNHLSWDNCIFLDETSFNSSMYRKRGWSEKGVKAVTHKTVLIGQSFSILAAVSPRNGLLAWRIRQKLTDEGKGQRVTVRWFVEFIAFLLHLIPSTKQYFIADNSNQHSSRDVNAMLESVHSPHEFHLLSRYSPDFNPIERCFNVWKADVKTTENMDEVKLRDKMAVDATKLSPTLVRHCYEHAVAHAYPRAIAGLSETILKLFARQN
jgi:hypothetical protein